MSCRCPELRRRDRPREPREDRAPDQLPIRSVGLDMIFGFAALGFSRLHSLPHSTVHERSRFSRFLCSCLRSAGLSRVDRSLCSTRTDDRGRAESTRRWSEDLTNRSRRWRGAHYDGTSLLSSSRWESDLFSSGYLERHARSLSLSVSPHGGFFGPREP